MRTHRTEGISASEGREGANGVGDGIKVGGGDGDGNCHEDVNVDGNWDRIREGEGEAKRRTEPRKRYRRDQALSFRTHHCLCRQRVALAGTR